MSDRSPRSLPALLVLFALLAVSCGDGEDRGRPIASLELLDFTVPGMFRQVSLQLGRPFLLELPAEGGDTTQRDLKLEDSDERAVMEELCRLDPTYQYRMDTPVWMMFPAGETARSSPFGRRIASFKADGGVFTVLKQLVVQALPNDTQIVMANAGKARPVKMQLEDATVREILAEIAAQGHLAFVVEPGSLRVSVVPE